MSTTALATRNEMTPSLWEMVERMAPIMHQSRLFGVSSPAAAAAIMVKGHELGLPLAASFDLIHVIDNKPSLSPRGALAILHASSEISSIAIDRLTDAKGEYAGHECTIKRRNGFEYAAKFTLVDATRAGLNKDGSGWAKYPENMCLWRAVGFAADVAAPDIIGGMKMADQFGADLSAGGDVIAGEWVDSDATAEFDESGQAAIEAQSLINDYGAEAVLAANGGTIPVTLEEVDAVRYQLIADTAGEGES